MKIEMTINMSKSAMNYRELSYPALIWGEDYVFLAKKIQDLEWIPRSQFNRLRQQARAGKVNLLDSKGMSFEVVDRNLVSHQFPLVSWLIGVKSIPVLSGGRILTIDEFKRQIKRAVWARQKGDYDGDFVGQLNESLAFAETYRDALNCVPKGM